MCEDKGEDGAADDVQHTDPRRAAALAELIAHLGRLAYLIGYEGKLNPAQWSALRFLARANPSARTTSGFVRAIGTTQGTATQTLAALVRKGLVGRERDTVDRRMVRLELTEKGRDLLEDDPLKRLAALIEHMPNQRSLLLAREIAELIKRLSAGGSLK